MSVTDLASRYDEFQKDAVRAITRDYQQDLLGRYLLVIPTGGGKTYTAVKSICSLFEQGILDIKDDSILWTAHRTELKEQARQTFSSFLSKTDLDLKLDKQIKVEMISQVMPRLRDDKTIKLVVIDEAHHSAATSYQPIFNNRNIGVLGLTATPSRHDGKSLDFEKESYSIGFPDLIKKGIILRPEIETIEGEQYVIDDIGGKADFEPLNNDIRNQKILHAIKNNSEKFRKIIIFVGTTKHTRALFYLLNKSDIADQYESISYITGDGNSEGLDRPDFIQKQKSFKRSIVINVDVLTEGYDDPTVNTVIMATPSKSKLYYMQAVGRAIRSDPGDDLKKSFIVEVVDDLPNIRYRIDNRWLFSEISDALEPGVRDFTFSSKANWREVSNNIFEEYAVDERDQVLPEYDSDNRYTLLLFRQYKGEGIFGHRAIFIENHNRSAVSNLFNFISEKLAYSNFSNREYHYESVFGMVSASAEKLNMTSDLKKAVYEAMENAAEIINNTDTNDVKKYYLKGSPWLTYIAMSYKEPEYLIDQRLIDFIKDMINRQAVLESITSKDYEEGSVLIKLPLPLHSSIGRILTAAEFYNVEQVVSQLSIIKQDEVDDHRPQVSQLISSSVLPIERREASSLITIARESITYYYNL